MEASFAVRVWLSVVLYTAIGLFGIVALTRVGPSSEALTDGYGTVLAHQHGQ